MMPHAVDPGATRAAAGKGDYQVTVQGPSPQLSAVIRARPMLQAQMTRFEKKRVLVVDDNDHVRQVLASCLTNTGYDVCEAFDGIDALHLMCRRRFDGVITDYHMPRLNGIQLWAISRELWPGLPVVLLSADAVPEAGNLRPGQPTWIRKPYDTAELLRVVGAAFESASVPKAEDVFGTS